MKGLSPPSGNNSASWRTHNAPTYTDTGPIPGHVHLKNRVGDGPAADLPTAILEPDVRPPGTVGNPVGGAVIRQAEVSRLSGKDHFVGEV